ncbi:MAG: FimD/PapC N-terminal domain-containing protein, partial [Acinetobacter sp.]
MFIKSLHRPFSRKDRFYRHPLALNIFLALYVGAGVNPVIAASDVQFNIDVMDIKDRSQIDLSQFAQAGYIMPGNYTMALQINDSMLPERPVVFLVPDDNPKGSLACLTPEIVGLLGLKQEKNHNLSWWHNNECLNTDSLPGMTAVGDIGAGALRITVPQAYLEYTAQNWDPPSRWDEGIAGVIFDYNLNAQEIRQKQTDESNTRSLSGSGVAGVNLGPWRLRADWQG